MNNSISLFTPQKKNKKQNKIKSQDILVINDILVIII